MTKEEIYEPRRKTMKSIRHFTKTDWYAYAGATVFDDGFDPFIAEFKLEDGTEITIISDQKGYELFLEPYRAYLFDVKVPFFDSEMAQRILAALIKDFELATDKKQLESYLITERWERTI